MYLCSDWFFRCRDKQRKEASRLQSVNQKLSAMNKLLMEENDRLQKQVSHLVSENGYMKQQLTLTTLVMHPHKYMYDSFGIYKVLMLILVFVDFQGTDASCDSVDPTPPQHPLRDANSPAG